MILSRTRCCLALTRPALGASSLNFGRNHGQKLARPVIFQPWQQTRQKHETIFDNLFEKPIDRTKVYIDEVIQSFGDRGINRAGGRVKLENMFKLFDLDIRFLVNEAKLYREMIKLQRALHPDKFLRMDHTSKLASDQLSVLINEAYQTLRHPYKRALYILRLKTNKSEDEIEKRLDDLKMDPNFLSDMMELREKIERGDGGPEQMKLAQRLQIDLDDLVIAVNRDLEIEDYGRALQKLGRLKFLANCHIALQDKMGSFSNF